MISAELIALQQNAAAGTAQAKQENADVHCEVVRLKGLVTELTLRVQALVPGGGAEGAEALMMSMGGVAGGSGGGRGGDAFSADSAGGGGQL